LGDVRRFKNVKALAALPDVIPKHHTSDTSIKGRSVIRPTGSISLCAALFMPSMVACRFNPILNQFAERLLATGLPGKVIICAVMHTLTHLI
jgi:transposase